MAEAISDSLEAIPQVTDDFAGLKHLLYQAVITRQAKAVIETGTDVGDSARIFSTALIQTGGWLWTIDTVPPKQDWLKTWPHQNITFVQADSKTVRVNGMIDLLFLDADHRYEHVIAELRQLGKFVKKGGAVLLHDTRHAEFGAGILRAILEWTGQMGYTWSEYPAFRGLAIIDVA